MKKNYQYLENGEKYLKFVCVVIICICLWLWRSDPGSNIYDKTFGVYGIIVGEKLPFIEKLATNSSRILLALFLIPVMILSMSYKGILLAKMVSVELDEVIDDAQVRVLCLWY